MRRPTESLLPLARFDAGQEGKQRQPLELSELTHDCADRIRPMVEPSTS
jgi:hypothetical protein